MTRSRWIALIVGETVALCCCLALFGFVAFGTGNSNRAAPTAIARATLTLGATATPPRTFTPEPTYTLVLQPRSTNATPSRSTVAARTPTRSLTTLPAAFNIIVPTPTAPRILYPIDYTGSFTVVTYAVTGKTVNDISQSLEASALSDPHEPTRRFYARTDWYLMAHWLWKETSLGCEVDKGDVGIAITVTLPALATTAGLAADVQNRWNTFIQNTQTHEAGHVKLIQQGTRDYQDKLGNFSAAPNCDLMQTRLRALFDDSFSEIDKANVYYDAQTQHGFTQRAVFP